MCGPRRTLSNARARAGGLARGRPGMSSSKSSVRGKAIGFLIWRVQIADRALHLIPGTSRDLPQSHGSRQTGFVRYYTQIVLIKICRDFPVTGEGRSQVVPPPPSWSRAVRSLCMLCDLPLIACSGARAIRRERSLDISVGTSQPMPQLVEYLPWSGTRSTLESPGRPCGSSATCLLELLTASFKGDWVDVCLSARPRTMPTTQHLVPKVTGYAVAKFTGQDFDPQAVLGHFAWLTNDLNETMDFQFKNLADWDYEEWKKVFNIWTEIEDMRTNMEAMWHHQSRAVSRLLELTGKARLIRMTAVEADARERTGIAAELAAEEGARKLERARQDALCVASYRANEAARAAELAKSLGANRTFLPPRACMPTLRLTLMLIPRRRVCRRRARVHGNVRQTRAAPLLR